MLSKPPVGQKSLASLPQQHLQSSQKLPPQINTAQPGPRKVSNFTTEFQTHKASYKTLHPSDLLQ